MSVSPDTLLQEFLDRQAIQDLIHRYSDAVTRGDDECIEELFAPHAVWENLESGLRFESAREFVHHFVEGNASLDLLIQTAHSPVIELLGAGRARATTTIHEMVRGVVSTESSFGAIGAEINVDRYGVYHDELAKSDGDWRFTHRSFVPFFTATGGVVGHVSVERPLLRPG